MFRFSKEFTSGCLLFASGVTISSGFCYLKSNNDKVNSTNKIPFTKTDLLERIRKDEIEYGNWEKKDKSNQQTVKLEYEKGYLYDNAGSTVYAVELPDRVFFLLKDPREPKNNKRCWNCSKMEENCECEFDSM